MKSGVWVLDHDTGYRNIKKDLVRKYGKEPVQQIWEKAGKNWEELCVRYAHLPEKMKQHTDGQMFRMAAVYMALKEAYPEAALEMLEAGVQREGKRIAKMLSCALYISGMDYVFLRIFAKMLDSYFNEDAGFQSKKHCISKDEVNFDINQCPYCKYLTEIGCPEIIRFSCEIDEWIYGNLPGLKFERTGTLGTGANRCDFCLKRAKQ